MLGELDPNSLVGGLAVVGLMLAGFWQLIVWVRDSPVKPDPWDAGVEQQLEVAEETCPHCSTPQSSTAWFCHHCGRAVGPYNNLMPYICVFSQGEVFRNGATDRLRANPFTIAGYLIYSLCNYFIAAPIYWFFFFKNLKRLKQAKLKEQIEVAE